MKRSVRKGPYFDPSAKNFIPFLNGVRLEKCHTVDEESGLAEIYDMDPKDSLGRRISLKHFIDLPSITLHGHVELRCNKY